MRPDPAIWCRRLLRLADREVPMRLRSAILVSLLGAVAACGPSDKDGNGNGNGGGGNDDVDAGPGGGGRPDARTNGPVDGDGGVPNGDNAGCTKMDILFVVDNSN